MRSLHRLLGAPEVVSIVSVTGGSGRRRAAACVRGGLYGVSILEHLIELLGIAFQKDASQGDETPEGVQRSDRKKFTIKALLFQWRRRSREQAHLQVP